MHFALRNEFPIENEGHIKTAMAYFDKYLKRFSALDRAVVAANIEKRANALNINIDSDWVTNYSRMFKDGAEISPDFNRNMGLRKDACVKGEIKIMVDNKSVNASDMLDKISALKGEAPGKAIVTALVEFDKLANLEHHYDADVIDPVLTVYGSLRNAEYDAVKVAADITNYQAVKLSRDQDAMNKVAKKFGEEFVQEFRAKPIEKLGTLTPPELSLFTEAIE